MYLSVTSSSVARMVSTADRSQMAGRLAAVASGVRQARTLFAQGDQACAAHLASFSRDQQAKLATDADDMLERGIALLCSSDDRWPSRLSRLPRQPAYLFCYGNLGLLDDRAVGMCGSRRASERGLNAAADCGALVAAQGWHVVSGYARGVDCATHHGALAAGAGTVVVLAEGINHFRVKRMFDDVPFKRSTVLVLSQFPPNQRWTAGAAMTRNGLIVTLGEALVVIEAGERGGTLAAGHQALKLGLPVLALEYADGPRPGNAQLINDGAQAIATPGRLRSTLAELDARPSNKMRAAA